MDRLSAEKTVLNPNIEKEYTQADSYSLEGVAGNRGTTDIRSCLSTASCQA